MPLRRPGFFTFQSASQAKQSRLVWAATAARENVPRPESSSMRWANPATPKATVRPTVAPGGTPPAGRAVPRMSFQNTAVICLMAPFSTALATLPALRSQLPAHRSIAEIGECIDEQFPRIAAIATIATPLAWPLGRAAVAAASAPRLQPGIIGVVKSNRSATHGLVGKAKGTSSHQCKAR